MFAAWFVVVGGLEVVVCCFAMFKNFSDAFNFLMTHLNF